MVRNFVNVILEDCRLKSDPAAAVADAFASPLLIPLIPNSISLRN